MTIRSRARFLSTSSFALALAFAFALGAVGACSSSSSSSPPASDGVDTGAREPDAASPTADSGDADAAPLPELLPDCTIDPGAPPLTVDANSPKDPIGGAAAFTMDQALAGYPAGATGQLTAAILTELGTIKCTLDDVHAPVSVANFIGLARGTRPYADVDGHWRLGHFYDGLTWHRVVPDFVIQGGDPDGDGTGGPGYDLVNENQVAESLGTLAMAGSAKAPSGSQFYVVVGAGPDAGPAADYNVFGTCTTDVAIAIAGVPRDADEKPTTAVHMMKVEIARCP